MKYSHYAKTSNFVENFRSGMIRVGSIYILGSLSGEHISNIGSSMNPNNSIRISGVLPGTILRAKTLPKREGAQSLYPRLTQANTPSIRVTECSNWGAITSNTSSSTPGVDGFLDAQHPQQSTLEVLISR